MEDIQYTGETLWPTILGHGAILASFLSAIFVALAYFYFHKTKEKSWQNLGRVGFFIHAASTFGLILMIFYIMINAMYEYNYVFNHVSDDLPMKYIFSAFWEGQEGSFMLWMFWHIVLGGIFIIRKDKHETGIILTIALVEAFLASMLLGIYIPLFGEEFKIGSNPTILLRSVMEAPIFANADYLSLIEGSGISPLLQNYWMTIHPPTLFLGFASTIIPFGYAIGGMMSKDHKTWLRPALRWSLFSAAILGTGILMGGAWAYEALGFGGYWAWDPVENASLVPWIILVAGIHTNLIAVNTGYSIKPTYIFYLLSFLTTIYSTFLTRSGILGETSAHAFTQMGLEWQLVAFVSFFCLLALFLYQFSRKSVPQKKTEEKLSSKEFWMLIGAIVLFFSAALISVSTSLPVYNAIVKSLFDPNYIGSVIDDPIEHYNKYQLWIAVFVAILSGTTQFLRYASRNWSQFARRFFMHVGIIGIIALILMFLSANQFVDITWQTKALLFAGIYGVIANLDYLVSFIKGNMKASASVISHLGFAILIFGVMFTGLNKSFVTSDVFGQTGLMNERKVATNVQLIKDAAYPVKDYLLEYKTDTLKGNLKYFDIVFQRFNEDKQLEEEFTVSPSAIYNTSFSKIGAWNPDTKHYWNKDIFTNITGYPKHLQDIEFLREMEDTLVFNYYKIALHDTIHVGEHVLELQGLTLAPKHKDLDLDSTELAFAPMINITNPKWDTSFQAAPALALRDGLVYQYPVGIDPFGLRIKLDEQIFDQVFTEENNLSYTDQIFKQGQVHQYEHLQIRLEGFEKQPVHKNYNPVDGDIAIGGRLTILDQDTNIQYESIPLYIIRDSKQFNIKGYVPEIGLHIRFIEIDPNTESMTFSFAKDQRNISEVGLLISENVPRSDMLVLEAIVFPGIKLVWIGSIMMMFGLLLGAMVRKRKITI